MSDMDDMYADDEYVVELSAPITAAAVVDAGAERAVAFNDGWAAALAEVRAFIEGAPDSWSAVMTLRGVLGLCG